MGKFGASVYSSCKHSSLVSMGIMGCTWVCLSFILLASNDFANFQVYHFQQNIKQKTIQMAVQEYAWKLKLIKGDKA